MSAPVTVEGRPSRVSALAVWTSLQEALADGYAASGRMIAATGGDCGRDFTEAEGRVWNAIVEANTALRLAIHHMREVHDITGIPGTEEGVTL